LKKQDCRVAPLLAMTPAGTFYETIKIDIVKKKPAEEKTGEGKEPHTMGKKGGFRSSTRPTG